MDPDKKTSLLTRWVSNARPGDRLFVRVYLKVLPYPAQGELFRTKTEVSNEQFDRVAERVESEVRELGGVPIRKDAFSWAINISIPVEKIHSLEDLESVEQLAAGES